jgi:hypothetical protein
VLSSFFAMFPSDFLKSLSIATFELLINVLSRS